MNFIFPPTRDGKVTRTHVVARHYMVGIFKAVYILSRFGACFRLQCWNALCQLMLRCLTYFNAICFKTSYSTWCAHTSSRDSTHFIPYQTCSYRVTMKTRMFASAQITKALFQMTDRLTFIPIFAGALSSESLSSTGRFVRCVISAYSRRFSRSRAALVQNNLQYVTLARISQ